MNIPKKLLHECLKDHNLYVPAEADRHKWCDRLRDRQMM